MMAILEKFYTFAAECDFLNWKTFSKIKNKKLSKTENLYSKHRPKIKYKITSWK